MRGLRGLGAVPTSQDSVYLKKDFFTYVTGFDSTLAASGSTTSTFNIDGDSDFFWTKFTMFPTVPGTTPDLSIVITDTTSGRQLMNSQVQICCIAGTGQIPFILPIERFMESKSTIKVDYFNGADSIDEFQLAFIGIKAFKAS